MSASAETRKRTGVTRRVVNRAARPPKPLPVERVNYAEAHARQLMRGQGRKLYNRLTYERFGMSGDEFLRRVDAGEIEDVDQPDIIGMVILRSLVNS